MPPKAANDMFGFRLSHKATWGAGIRLAEKRFSTKFGFDPVGLVGPNPIMLPGGKSVVLGDEAFMSKKF